MDLIYHGGGGIVEADSDEFHLLRGLATLTNIEERGYQCAPLTQQDIFTGVTTKSNLEVMAQAKLALTGTPLDASYFETRDPSISLEEELAAFFNEPPQPAFGDRIKDIFNDVLQVRSFEPGLKNAAIQLEVITSSTSLNVQRRTLATAVRPMKAHAAQPITRITQSFARWAERMSYSAVESSLRSSVMLSKRDYPLKMPSPWTSQWSILSWRRSTGSSQLHHLRTPMTRLSGALPQQPDSLR